MSTLPELPEPTSEGDRSLTLHLPLPSAKLSPNAREHRFAKANEIKKHRCEVAELAFHAAMVAFRRRPRWQHVVIEPVFFFAQNRRRDADNLIARLKSTIDGCVDAGLLDDDVGVAWMSPVITKDKQCPRLTLIIRCGRVARVAIEHEGETYDVEPSND